MVHKSVLAREVALEEASRGSGHSPVCCLIYATQNGWKLPILFEEMGVPYDWALVDFEQGQQRSPGFLAINPNGRIPALIRFFSCRWSISRDSKHRVSLSISDESRSSSGQKSTLAGIGKKWEG